MRTLILRDVPDALVRSLDELAAEEGVSVPTMAVRILSRETTRTHNRRLLNTLPDVASSADDIVTILDSERARR